MEDRKKKDLIKVINWYLEKIEKGICSKDNNKHTRDHIEQFGTVTIPPQIIIEKKLVNFMKGVGLRFIKFKKETDIIARRWQQQVDQWLKENNMSERHYLEKIERNKTTDRVSPRLNGSWNGNQRNSSSDERQNCYSSSSQEAESPKSQEACERNATINHRSNPPAHWGGNSSSPLQFEKPVFQNLNPAKFNANLSIDPKEIIPPNKTQASPVKPVDRFHIAMEPHMFKAVKLPESPSEKIKDNFLSTIKRMNLFNCAYPSFLREHSRKVHSSDQIRNTEPDSGGLIKCLKRHLGKNKDSTQLSKTHQNSNSMPSTSQQGARESSKCPDVKHDRKRHMDSSSHTAVTAKELEKQQPSQDNQNLPSTSQQGAEEYSKSCSGSKHNRKTDHIEKAQSIANSKESKSVKQPTQGNKNFYSMPQEGTESTKTHSISKNDRKRKHMESSQSAAKTKEVKEEHQPTQDSRLKHVSRTNHNVKSKESYEEPQLARGRTLNSKETAHSFSKANQFKNGYQLPQDGKLKLDSKQALGTRNFDKNHIKKKRDTPDESILLEITSSKKERSSVYHGVKKDEVPKLGNLCIDILLKGIDSDPTRYINEHVDFRILATVFEKMRPEKLQKLEDEITCLKNNTDDTWKYFCTRDYKLMLHLKREDENWREHYERCRVESDKKLRNLAASISASSSKAKADRQIKLTTVDGPPTKRPKTDHSVITNGIGNHSSIKPLLNSCHPSTSRSDAPITPKGTTSHAKSSHKTNKKDAPLMHKVKKTMGQLHRNHRS